MVDITPDLKFRALEIAERSVHQPYCSQGNADPYRDKDLGEIIKRADRILAYALDTSITPDAPSSLIERLRTVLCEKS